jgi:hypothetical protein
MHAQVTTQFNGTSSSLHFCQTYTLSLCSSLGEVMIYFLVMQVITGYCPFSYIMAPLLTTFLCTVIQVKCVWLICTFTTSFKWTVQNRTKTQKQGRAGKGNDIREKCLSPCRHRRFLLVKITMLSNCSYILKLIMSTDQKRISKLQKQKITHYTKHTNL